MSHFLDWQFQLYACDEELSIQKKRKLINGHVQKSFLCIIANFQLNTCSQYFTNNKNTYLGRSVFFVWTEKRKKAHTLHGNQKLKDNRHLYCGGIYISIIHPKLIPVIFRYVLTGYINDSKKPGRLGKKLGHILWEPEKSQDVWLLFIFAFKCGFLQLCV